VAYTQDHKPSLAAERARVEANGGEVITTIADDGFVECRVDIKGTGYPGLSMTRCFGDLSVKPCGVISKPEVVQWPWPEEPGAAVFAASDGVWEFLETKEVADMILGALASGASREEALKRVLLASRRRWSESEGDYCDDITMVLATLDEPKRMHTSLLRFANSPSGIQVRFEALGQGCWAGLCDGGRCAVM